MGFYQINGDLVILVNKLNNDIVVLYCFSFCGINDKIKKFILVIFY